MSLMNSTLDADAEEDYDKYADDDDDDAENQYDEYGHKYDDSDDAVGCCYCAESGGSPAQHTGQVSQQKCRLHSKKGTRFSSIFI